MFDIQLCSYVAGLKDGDLRVLLDSPNKLLESMGWLDHIKVCPDCKKRDDRVLNFLEDISSSMKLSDPNGLPAEHYSTQIFTCAIINFGGAHMQYSITGTLYPGVPWEDFSSPDGPYVTMIVFGQPDAHDIPEGQSFDIKKDDDDGWYDVTVRELTEETAKTVLAEINKVNSADIKIIQRGVCASI